MYCMYLTSIAKLFYLNFSFNRFLVFRRPVIDVFAFTAL
jgi:hypothetical protein